VITAEMAHPIGSYNEEAELKKLKAASEAEAAALAEQAAANAPPVKGAPA
jgi:hypothetical protein